MSNRHYQEIKCSFKLPNFSAVILAPTVKVPTKTDLGDILTGGYPALRFTCEDGSQSGVIYGDLGIGSDHELFYASKLVNGSYQKSLYPRNLWADVLSVNAGTKTVIKY